MRVDILLGGRAICDDVAGDTALASSCGSIHACSRPTSTRVSLDGELWYRMKSKRGEVREEGRSQRIENQGDVNGREGAVGVRVRLINK